MSTTSDSRRVTRQSSRSREGTPSRVTNKASGAYGGKGRSHGAGYMSAGTGNQIADNVIGSAIPEEESTELPTEGEAGPLPSLREETETRTPRARPTKGKRGKKAQSVAESEVGTSSHSHHEAHDTTQDLLDAQLQGAFTSPAGANAQTQSATAGQAQAPADNAENIAPIAETTTWFSYSMWAPRQPTVEGEVHGGFWNNYNNHDGSIFGLPRGSVIKTIIGSAIIALLAMILIPVSRYASAPLPSTNNASQSDRIHGRLSKLESIVHRLNSMSPFSNTAPTIHKVNWFAAGNGAVVDPYLSSPVDLVCHGVSKSTFYSWIFNIGGYCNPASHMHGQVLRPWSEPDDRFCSPPGRGKLQLSVLTPRPVAPTELVIEHLPKDAAIFIGNAPKEVELWVRLDDPEVYYNVRSSVVSKFPQWSVESSPQHDRELDPQQALPPQFALVGRWVYNIWEADNVQSFTIPFDLKALGVASSQFAVRVNSNWGDTASSCLYRLRLFGMDASGIIQELDADPRLQVSA